MAKTKSMKATAVKGGKAKMFGKMGANPAKPGVITHSQPGVGAKFAAGGKGKMFKEMEAGSQKPGMTGPGGAFDGEKPFATGGKTPMFGKQTAKAARVA